MVHRKVSTHQLEVLRERAWLMRHVPEESEAALWQTLRRRQLGVCFRRQAVLQGYIADFYASEAKLVVEVDGPWHAKRAAADARRDRVLSRAGYCVLRVDAYEALVALPTVVARIAMEVAQAGSRR